MAKVIYNLPGPSTSLLHSPVFEERAKRTCAIICEYESESEENSFVLALIFEGIEAYKCIYYNAVSLQLIQEAYDKVVDFGESRWLAEIRSNLNKSDADATNLSHLSIYFDDGPAYEFICRDFRTENWLAPFPK